MLAKIKRFPLIRGQDTQADRRITPESSIESLENCYYSRDGRLVTRPGYESAWVSQLGEYDAPYAGLSCASLGPSLVQVCTTGGGELCSIQTRDPSSISGKSEIRVAVSVPICAGLSRHYLAGDPPGVTSTATPVTITDLSVCSASDYLVTTYLAGTAGFAVVWAARDMTMLARKLVSTSCYAIRAVAPTTSQIAVLYSELTATTGVSWPSTSLPGYVLKSRAWGNSAVGEFGDPVEVWHGGAYHGPALSAVVDDDYIWVSFQQGTASTNSFRTIQLPATINPSPASSHAVSPCPTMTGPHSVQRHGLYVTPGGTYVWNAYVTTGGTTGVTIAAYTGGSWVSTNYVAGGLARSSGPITIGVSPYTSHVMILAGENVTTSPMWLHQHRRMIVSDTGIVRSTTLWPGLPASPPTLVGGTSYVYWVRHAVSSSPERCYVLQDDSGDVDPVPARLPAPIARTAFRQAPGAFPTYTTPVSELLSPMCSDGTSWVWAARELEPGANPLAATAPTVATLYRYSLVGDGRARMVQQDGALVVSGQIPLHVDRGQAIEASWVVGPGTVFAAEKTYSVLGLGTRSFKVVYEWVDANGQRHQSEPSLAASAYSTGSYTITIPTVPFTLLGRQAVGTGRVYARLYRNATNYGAIHYDTGQVADVTLQQGVIATSIVDYSSDAVLLTNEPLYTDQGILGHVLPPGGTAISRHKGRVFTGSGRELWYSNPTPPDDTAVSWYDAAYLELPEDITALASHGDALLIWTASAQYALYGEGPTRTGEGGWDEPVYVGGIGCLGQATVVEAPTGCYFQGVRGIYAIPVGGVAALLISAPIDDQLTRTPLVSSGCAAVADGQIRFTAVPDGSGTSAVLVYDYEGSSLEPDAGGRWSVWTSGHISGPRGSCMWGTTHYVIGSTGAITQCYSKPTCLDNSASFMIRVRTSAFQPSGPSGWARCRSVTLHGVLAGTSHSVSIAVTAAGGGASTDYVGAGTVAISGVAGAEFSETLYLSRQQGASWRVDISEPSQASGAVTLTELDYEWQPMAGRRRDRSGERNGAA